MDAFEPSLGYRSLDPLSLQEHQAKERYSDAEVLTFAKDLFDATLAEVLRSTGEWHWQLEIREVAEQVAETLQSAEKGTYENLRQAILDHYAHQYRIPNAQQFKRSLRERREQKLSLSPVSVDSPEIIVYKVLSRRNDQLFSHLTYDPSWRLLYTPGEWVRPHHANSGIFVYFDEGYARTRVLPESHDQLWRATTTGPIDLQLRWEPDPCAMSLSLYWEKRPDINDPNGSYHHIYWSSPYDLVVKDLKLLERIL